MAKQNLMVNMIVEHGETSMSSINVGHFKVNTILTYYRKVVHIAGMVDSTGFFNSHISYIKFKHYDI